MADRALKKSIEKAIQNPVLTGTLGRFSEAYVIARAKAYEGIDFEELRSRIAEIKRCTAEHLYELAEEFKKNAEAKGAKVFITNDTEKIKNTYLM